MEDLFAGSVAHIFIAKVETMDGGFYVGNGAMDVMCIILHEMGYAFLGLMLCRCPECEKTPDRLGETGHGNTFLSFASLVEEELNQLAPW